MKRYIIEEAKCGITEGGIACGPVDGSVVATVRFKDEGESKWISLVEAQGIPNVYLSDKDIHEDLVKEDFENDEFTAYMEEHYINEFNGIEFGTDYSDTFESISNDPENPAVPLIKYLIALVRCDMEEVDGIISMATGKYADELEIPVSDVEEDFLDEYDEEYEEEYSVSLPDNLDKETLYRMRLSLETDIATDSIYHELDSDAFEAEKEQLQAVIDRCEDEADYNAWKESFISEEFKKLNGKRFLTCTYLFAGIGQYEAIIPEEEKESFQCWINGNGSAFFGGDREATEEEIKTYIALHAGEET